MSCWHGCEPWHGWPPARGRYGPVAGPAEWLEDFEDEPPMRRGRHRRVRTGDRELSAVSLESRLDDLQEELRRVEAALVALRRPAEESDQP
jgi:hypothetical protein